MLVEWDPENGEEKQSWDFNPDDVLRKDASQIEKHYGGGGWDAWLQGLRVGEIDARVVLLWYMLKLIHPKYQFKDVPDFRVRQLKVQMGVRELKELYERAKKTKLAPDIREAFESQFEIDMQEALEREGIHGEAKIVDGVLAIEGVEEVDLPKLQ
jgi:hypothetical protein